MKQKLQSMITECLRMGLLCLWTALMVMSCADKDILSPVTVPEEEGIQVGEEVRFTACVPKVERTRSITESDYNDLINKFKTVQDYYKFRVEMLTDNAGKPNPVGETTLVPKTTGEGSSMTYDALGYLVTDENASPLYWQSNNTPYAFRAASNEPASDGARVAANQSTAEGYFAQDYITGFGYVKSWDNEQSKPTYDLDAPNYLTSKQWYKANKATGLASDEDYYKTIPLYMQHQRARISVIMRAGEGINREHLQYDEEHNITTARDMVAAQIFSYKDGNAIEVSPYLSGREISYTERDGSTTSYMTACYDAIVEPYNYAEHLDKPLVHVEVSNMKFSFYTVNDAKYVQYLQQKETDPTAAEALKADVVSRYNLKAGEHLILDVTLSTSDRKVLITAYVEDWEEWPFITNCNDYGHASDPIAITSRDELIGFLKDPEKNKAGNIAFISPTSLDLESESWPVSELSGYPLKATLSLAGATLKVNHTLFPGGISSTGSVVNGIVQFGNPVNSVAPTEPIECALARQNDGSIERVTVANIKGSQIVATSGGLVRVNTGTISRCTSNMPVVCQSATQETYIGGIAAISQYPRDDSEHPVTTTIPVIEQCTVNARVASNDTHIYGGGIVGQAEGKIMNNTYEYGITILQNGRFQNIVAAKGQSDLYKQELVTGNRWPTSVVNHLSDGNEFANAQTDHLFTYVLDSQEGLRELITNSSRNVSTVSARFSNNFTVIKETWMDGEKPIGSQIEDLTIAGLGNVFCEIDGNGYTVTLDGSEQSPMLFSNILNHVHDITLVCMKSIIAVPKQDQSTTDAIAPLANSVVNQGKLSDIRVKMAADCFVQASNPSGLVVAAKGGATIEDCHSNALLKVVLPQDAGSHASIFAGGLVNTAEKAQISRCTYHGTTFIPATNGTVYYGGIVGGILTSTEQTVTPQVVITDCTSWLSWTDTETDKHTTWGGIIGYSVYKDSQNRLINALSGCQGNWWTANHPIGQKQSGMTDDEVIGKKNSIAPVQDSNYGKIE